MRQIWTRNGKTVKCDACNETVKRPRGRAVANKRQAGPGMPQEMRQSERGETTPEGLDKLAQDAAEAGIPHRGVKAPQVDAAQLQKMIEAAVEKATQQAEKQAEERVEQAVQDAIAAQAPKQMQVELKQPNGTATTTTVDKPHPLLEEVLRRVACGIRNLLFIGPSGSGKTTLVAQLAEALGLPFSAIPWSGGTTEGSVLGRMTPEGDYIPSQYVLAFEIPSVHNWDEIDRADPNVPLCANSGIENGYLFLPARKDKPTAKRDPMSILTATGNTWGFGADMMYVGSNQLDGAFKSRFAGGIFFVDYDAGLEASLVPEREYRETFWQIRQRINEHKLRRIWGTRELVRGAMLLRGGYSQPEVFGALTVGFSADEVAKIGGRPV